MVLEVFWVLDELCAIALIAPIWKKRLMDSVPKYLNSLITSWITQPCPLLSSYMKALFKQQQFGQDILLENLSNELFNKCKKDKRNTTRSAHLDSRRLHCRPWPWGCTGPACHPHTGRRGPHPWHRRTRCSSREGPTSLGPRKWSGTHLSRLNRTLCRPHRIPRKKVSKIIATVFTCTVSAKIESARNLRKVAQMKFNGHDGLPNSYVQLSTLENTFKQHCIDFTVHN